MACSRCGSRCIGRYCDECAMDLRHGDAAADTSPADGHAEPQPYECPACGHEWTTTDPGRCPNCDAPRRRYVGELP